MEKFFIKTASLEVVLALALLGLTPVQVDGTTIGAKPILGIVTFGKTTVTELKELLERKGCEFKEEDLTYKGSPKKNGVKIQVSPGCFQLPGGHSVQFFARTTTSPLVDAIQVEVQHFESLRSIYRQALESAYGPPSGSGYIDENKSFAFWDNPSHDIYVFLTNYEREKRGVIYYNTGEEAVKILRDFKKSHAISDEDLKNL